MEGNWFAIAFTLISNYVISVKIGLLVKNMKNVDLNYL